MSEASVLNCLRLPGRLDIKQAAQVLGFMSHDIAILVRAKLLKPLGDPALGNCHALTDVNGVHLFLFDYDNYVALGMPPATAYGQPDRMAPEIRRLFVNGLPPAINALSDRYAIATVLHDLILAKHPAAGFDDTDEGLEQAMSGGWPHDPLLGVDPMLGKGFPTSILSSELACTFRRGMSVNPDERPSPSEWVKILTRNFNEIWICDRCRGPSFIDPIRIACPHCHTPFSTYKLVFPSLGKSIACDRAAVPIGRADLTSPRVSSLHAVARKCGPETTIKFDGRNGGFLWNGKAWILLKDIFAIHTGDRLRFADVECYVEELN